MGKTTIQVSDDLVRRLRGLKRHPRQPYEEVIEEALEGRIDADAEIKVVQVSKEHHAAMEHLQERWGTETLDGVVERLLARGRETVRELYEARKAAVDAACREHGIARLVAFGSRARGEAGPESDLDLAALYPEDADLFDVVHANDALAAAFGMHVDVVSLTGARPRLREKIERDGVALVG